MEFGQTDDAAAIAAEGSARTRTSVVAGAEVQTLTATVTL